MSNVSRRPVRATAIAGLAAAISVSAPVLAQSVTVTLNGSPLTLNPGPQERAGRIFVPLRGIFEQLGA